MVQSHGVRKGSHRVRVCGRASEKVRARLDDMLRDCIELAGVQLHQVLFSTSDSLTNS